MSRNLPLPFFPVPPRDYDQAYFAELVRSFSTSLEQSQNPGEGRHTRLVLTDMQQNDQGLEDGMIFQQDGFLKISLVYKPHPAGTPAAGGVGDVTVTTP